MTAELVDRLEAQAMSALSLYDRSGVVAEFEDAFGAYLGSRYTLATCSGTAALHSIYYGCELGPGDEVICSDYGFFATATPLLSLGVQPRFVDCSSNGTLCPERLADSINERTRAVVVTHMWGQPAQLDDLLAICEDQGVDLLEDCSHAHGARFDDLPVGSFGRAAAWSLQSKKTIWAGEGGVLSTDDTSIFERALLLGHFNKRALQDIDPESPNYAYAFTGTGLKYRAHPLGLAVAVPQVKGLDELVAGRQWFAERLLEALAEVPGFEVLGSSDGRRYHGYYALVSVVDPTRAGFTNLEFVEALRAENLYTADVPGQMTSLHRLPVFADLGTCADGSLPNSTRISAQAVKFFVPHDRNSDDDSTLAELTVRAVRKVSRLLGARQ